MALFVWFSHPKQLPADAQAVPPFLSLSPCSLVCWDRNGPLVVVVLPPYLDHAHLLQNPIQCRVIEVTHPQTPSSLPPEDHIEELQTYWTVGTELVGKGDGDLNHLIPPCLGGELGDLFRELVRQIEDHPIKGSDVPESLIAVE